MGPKNAATGPTDHGLTVSPPPPPAPPAQEEMKLEYTDVHKRFKTLVDDLLTGFLEELGVSPETFMEVATKLASNKLNQFVVNSILIVDDFLHFKNMMVQRNIELTQQVLQQLEEQRSGAAAAPSPEKPEIVAAEEPEVPQPETPEKPAQAGGQPAAPAEADEADADLAAAIAASLQVQQTAARQDSREDEELKQALALSLQEEETRKEVQEAAKVVEEREREETLATSSSSSSAAAAASSSSGGAVRAMVEEGAKLAAEAAPAEPELAKQGSLKGKEPAAAPAAAAAPPPPPPGSPPKVTLPESPAHRSGLAALNPPKKLAPLAAPAERAPTFNRRSSIGASIKSAGFSSTASTTAGMSGAAGFGAGGGGVAPEELRQLGGPAGGPGGRAPEGAGGERAAAPEGHEELLRPERQPARDAVPVQRRAEGRALRGRQPRRRAEREAGGAPAAAGRAVQGRADGLDETRDGSVDVVGGHLRFPRIELFVLRGEVISLQIPRRMPTKARPSPCDPTP